MLAEPDNQALYHEAETFGAFVCEPMRPFPVRAPQAEALRGWMLKPGWRVVCG